MVENHAAYSNSLVLDGKRLDVTIAVGVARLTRKDLLSLPVVHALSSMEVRKTVERCGVTTISTLQCVYP
jgi:hypothetical protein